VDKRREWIEPDHPILSVRQQAEILGLNRSAIYYQPRVRQLKDKQLQLLDLVDELYTKYPFMDTRQMSQYISAHHYPCQRHES